jgi:dUTP pyrophosphatase
MINHHETTPQTGLFEPLFEGVQVPSRATKGAAGYDVRAFLRDRNIQIVVGTKVDEVHVVDDVLVLPPGCRATIPLGFRAKLPAGIEGQLRLRSSVGFIKGLIIPNAPATIDPDYPGEWLVIVSNTLSVDVSIKHNERIAQIVFARFESVSWQFGTVGQSSDRIGGLGSTGSH